MLVLHRYGGQSFTLFLEDGREISINVLNIVCNNSVFARIGIDAPKEIRIMRDELLKGEVINE